MLKIEWCYKNQSPLYFNLSYITVSVSWGKIVFTCVKPIRRSTLWPVSFTSSSPVLSTLYSEPGRMIDSPRSFLTSVGDLISLQNELWDRGLLCCEASLLSGVVYGELLYRALLIGHANCIRCLLGEWRCRSVGGEFRERCSFNPRGFIPLVNTG